MRQKQGRKPWTPNKLAVYDRGFRAVGNLPYVSVERRPLGKKHPGRSWIQSGKSRTASR